MTDTPAVEQQEPKNAKLVRSLLLLVLFAWALRSLVVAPFSIPSGSMLPTMMVGDYLFVAKWPYGYSRYSFPFQFPPIDGRLGGDLPRRGDIVIFRRPGAEQEDWVKRVIGLPGDTVQLADGALILNGKPVPRVAAGMLPIRVSPNSPCRVAPGATPFGRRSADGTLECLYPAFRETLPGGPTYQTLDQVESVADDFGPITVPADRLFLMGDNRDDSMDSRYSTIEGGIGLVPLDNLVGRATVRFWSTDGSASWINPLSWFTALRGNRIGRSYNQ